MAPDPRHPRTAPTRPGRGLWRVLAEVTGGALLMLLTQAILRGRGPSAGVQLLLAGLALALLVLRRRSRTASLLAVSAVLGLLPAAGLPAAVVAYGTARRLPDPRRRSAVLLAAAATATLVCGVLAPVTGYGSHPFGLAAGAVLAVTTLVVPGLLGSSSGQEDRLVRALRERATAAEAARRLADSEARIQERSRIAAEMHDLIGHRLSLISLHAGGLELALQQRSPELRDEAALVRRTVADAMRELREALGVLGPLDRDTGTAALTATTGTRADVEALVAESRSGGIPVELRWDGPDLDGRAAQLRRAVHPVVRESLTNVHRYAAGARVAVAVTHTEDRVAVLVHNEPPAAPAVGTGLGSGRGHAGLRERVGLLGGTLAAGPTAAGGFAVSAFLPAEPGRGTSPGRGGARPERSEAVGPRPGQEPAAVHRRAVRALGGFLGLMGVGVLMLGSLLLVSQAFPEPDTSLPVPTIGMPRRLVEATVYDSAPVRAAATGREPARAASVTSCLYGTGPVGAEGPGPSAGAEPDRLGIVRYCFRGDTLATIDRFTVPMAARTSAWESR
ncbi:histidine kinase [Kitasatospora sp. NPDC002227]|uniref:sensor histidine kinase n=1 Tax=Kitasatospora sp. NPDC002227 TaxID=3154773 RepID=UPI0033296BFF